MYDCPNYKRAEKLLMSASRVLISHLTLGYLHSEAYRNFTIAKGKILAFTMASKDLALWVTSGCKAGQESYIEMAVQVDSLVPHKHVISNVDLGVE
jgi:hypothetical protein